MASIASSASPMSARRRASSFMLRPASSRMRVLPAENRAALPELPLARTQKETSGKPQEYNGGRPNKSPEARFNLPEPGSVYSLKKKDVFALHKWDGRVSRLPPACNDLQWEETAVRN